MEREPLFVILEGPDGAGKSTLARGLVAWLTDEHGPTVSQHLTSHSEFHEYELPLKWRDHGLHTVQDRCMLSALAYDPVLRAPGVYKWREADIRGHLEDIAQQSMMLYLHADVDELKRRLLVRGDDLITPGMLEQIVANYEEELKWYCSVGGNVYYMDTTGQFPTAMQGALAMSLLEKRVFKNDSV